MAKKPHGAEPGASCVVFCDAEVGQIATLERLLIVNRGLITSTPVVPVVLVLAFAVLGVVLVIIGVVVAATKTTATENSYSC